MGGREILEAVAVNAKRKGSLARTIVLIPVHFTDRHLDACPNQLTPMKDFLSLVDGGFAINSPFPLILQPQRAVDLIVSFDYSLEAPFEVRSEAGFS